MAAVLTVLVLTACSSEQDGDPAPASAQESPAPEGGTAENPTTVEATTSLMEWVPAPGAVDNTVTTNGTWFLTVESSGHGYRLDGPDRSFGTGEDTTQITNALLDTGWAVVVRQDQAERQPAVAEVTDLGDGSQYKIGQDGDVKTTAGGTWALGGDTLVHATTSPQGDYCVATVDLVSRVPTRGWCVPPEHGFNAAHVTSAGITLLAFDDAKPTCRTVGTVSGDSMEPFPGVPDCKAWEGAVLEDDQAVWSVIPDESDVDAAQFFARNGDDYFDLGPGSSSTLVPCADAAYFVRDPQVEGDPAQLLRWDGTSLTVVYEAPPGQSFLEAPRCGDRALVVSALSEGGDEQVMAALG
jgi:hypothetical protein